MIKSGKNVEEEEILYSFHSLEKLKSNVEEICKKTEVDGLAVTITDAEMLDSPLREIINKGIPVIAINIPDFRAENERIPYQFYIGMNEYACGERLATLMLEEKPMPKRAVIAIHEIEHSGLKKRADVIKEVLSEKGIQADEIYISPDPIIAVKKFNEYRVEHPETDAIFTLGPLSIKPALDFLSENGLFNKVKLATVDLTPETLNGIETGKIVCAAYQAPFLQGFLPILWFYDYYQNRALQGKKNIFWDPLLLTRITYIL